MADEIKITGLREVQKKLYNFSQQLGDRVVYGALSAGANYLRKKVTKEITSSGIKSKSGRLLKGFAVAKSKIHRGRLSTDMIGVYLSLKKDGKNSAKKGGKNSAKKGGKNSAKKDGKNSAFYGRFLNDGHTSRGGKKIAGKQFVQKAFSKNKEQSARLIVLNASAAADLLIRKVGL